ncbi:MAG: hypothetical protein HY062_07335, partial [Bacteroidetes bacterium]|nr:hypothetical protein [Bacteroidota bacterium]
VSFKYHYFSNNSLIALKESELKEGDILSIIRQGDYILPDSLTKLNNLFSTFKTTNWVRGVHIESSDEKKYDTTDVSNYRIVPYDIYIRLKNNSYNFSLSHYFFKYNPSLLIKSSEADIFMYLIFNYQLNVVVDGFVIPDKATGTKITIENSQEVLYMEQLKKFRLKTTRLTRIYNWLIRLPVIKNPTQSKWLLKTEFNYPLVFRKDLKNNTYFLNKF